MYEVDIILRDNLSEKEKEEVCHFLGYVYNPINYVREHTVSRHIFNKLRKYICSYRAAVAY